MARCRAVAARPVVARALVASIVTGILAACIGAGATAPPASVGLSATSDASAAPTGQTTLSPTPAATFPTAAFAGMSLEMIRSERVATYDSILTDISGGGGIAATVMAAEGMWSGAAGKADGVHAVQLDSQFGIGSVTKSVVAAQVMQLVEAGELSLDDPATDHLPADFAFDTNGAAIRQLLDMRSGIPDWYGEAMEAEVANNRTRVWKQSDVLALVDPARRPAGASEYADTNYNLLGLVIEHVRRRPLVEVLREGVLRVEGTERLIYQPDEIPTDPMAMPLGRVTGRARGGRWLPPVALRCELCWSGGQHRVRLDLPRPVVAGVLRRRDRFGGLAH